MAPVTGQGNGVSCPQYVPEVWVDALQAASIHTEKDTRGTQMEASCRPYMFRCPQPSTATSHDGCPHETKRAS